MKAIRLDEMEQFILQQGTVSMQVLCGQFGVSMNTVRRDIARLIERGTVEKVYGGVSARSSEQLTAFDVRSMARSQQKMDIARRAAALVEDGDFLFIDSGTTVMYLTQYIPAGCRVTVLTHNLQCVHLSLPYPNVNLLVLPGQLQRETYSLTGIETLSSLRKYHIRKVFMAASAVSLAHGVMNSSSFEYEIKRDALKQSDERILLVDAEKFDRTAMLTYAKLSDFSTLVTDREPPENYRTYCAEHRVKIYCGE